jgi:D-sedoheptulose 7-phosphate isomerase
VGCDEDVLFDRFPELTVVGDDFQSAFQLLKEMFSRGGTLYVCGNGGSAADAEHIVGELMKGFLLGRPLRNPVRDALGSLFGAAGVEMSENLQEGLPAVSLTGHPSLSTAFANDVAPELIFAQQLYALAKPGDALLAISTSGNSGNVVRALMMAKAMGVASLALTGRSGGKCAELADVAIRVPEDETYKIQELHLPIYHALCAMLEEDFYGGES